MFKNIRHETVVECYVVLSQAEETTKNDEEEKETTEDDGISYRRQNHFQILFFSRHRFYLNFR